MIIILAHNILIISILQYIHLYSQQQGYSMIQKKLNRKQK